MRRVLTTWPTWMQHAECRGVRGFTEAPEDVRRQWCDVCPVTAECAAWIGDEDPYGEVVARVRRPIVHENRQET